MTFTIILILAVILLFIITIFKLESLEKSFNNMEEDYNYEIAKRKEKIDELNASIEKNTKLQEDKILDLKEIINDNIMSTKKFKCARVASASEKNNIIPFNDKKKCLIVDDDGLQRDVIRIAIEDDWHMQVYEAGSYEEAVTLLENNTFDIAFIDYNLEQERNGNDLFKYCMDNNKLLKTNNGHKKTKIIIYTGNKKGAMEKLAPFGVETIILDKGYKQKFMEDLNDKVRLTLQ